jgi:hypothetical protein
LPDRLAARTILAMADEEAPVPFTDAELAFLRHVRFGELPARVRPDDLVPMRETDPKRDLPDDLFIDPPRYVA